jgi:hypothetical protein
MSFSLNCSDFIPPESDSDSDSDSESKPKHKCNSLAPECRTARNTPYKTKYWCHYGSSNVCKWRKEGNLCCKL